MAESANRHNSIPDEPSRENGDNATTARNDGHASSPSIIRRPEKPLLTHERVHHVFGFLTDFAGRYPDLCEGDKAMYRDLCRAALVAIDDEEKCESMMLARGVDAVLFRVCREGVGARLLRQLREAGVTVRLVEGNLRAGPKEKLTPAFTERIRRWKEAIRDALQAEAWSDPKLCKRA